MLPGHGKGRPEGQTWQVTYPLCFIFRSPDYYHTCYALSGLAIVDQEHFGEIIPEYNLLASRVSSIQKHFYRNPNMQFAPESQKK